MAYKAIVEIGLHLASFKNLNMSLQGVYQLRFAIYHLNTDRTKVMYEVNK
jgi:hypothetical protein